MYRPTQKALDLFPVVFAIMHWGLKYNHNTDMTIPNMRELNNKLKRAGSAPFTEFRRYYIIKNRDEVPTFLSHEYSCVRKSIGLEAIGQQS